MTRTVLLGGALLTAALAAGACNPVRSGEARARDRGDRPMTVAARLQCPERQSRLRLVETAADGRSCRYSGPDGQEVTLGYLAVTESPQAALLPIETEFKALVPAAAAPEPGALPRDRADVDADADASVSARASASASADWNEDRDGDRARDSGGDSGRDEGGVPTPPRPPEPPQVERRWSSGHGGSDRVTINLPFLHIDADEGTGRAHIRTLGAEIDADDRANRAVIRAGWGGKKTVINAHDDGSVEMRFGSVGQRRADLMYVVSSDRAGPQGFSSAAYVAKGPVNGPLVIATARARDNIHGRHDEGLDDLKELVNRNVRVTGR